MRLARSLGATWSHLWYRLFWHSGAVLIGYASLLHLSWAVLVGVVPIGPPLPTPLYWLQAAIGSDTGLAWALAGAAVLTLGGVLYYRRWFGLLLMLPQQMVLIISMVGALVAVATGTYPDGSHARPLYILKDQLGTILLAPAYTIALLVFHNVFRRYPGVGY